MSNIEWTEKTWNPTTGCNKVSAGCKFCYAEKQHFRLQHMHQGKYTKGFAEGVQMHEDELLKPLRWQKPSLVFVNSMSDLFHADVPFEFIDKVFAVIGFSQNHTFQILTKRPERMLEYFTKHYSQSKIVNACRLFTMMGEANYEKIKAERHHNYPGSDGSWPMPNVWLGTSCEDQATTNLRIPYLLQVPASVRFLSCEPLLGAIDLIPPINYPIPGTKDYAPPIQWVIAGGESGNKARPVHPDWLRGLRDQCQAAGVPFFFKQWGEWGTEMKFPKKRKNIAGTYLSVEGHRCGFECLKQSSHHYETLYKIGKHLSGRLLDGREHNEYPVGYTPKPPKGGLTAKEYKPMFPYHEIEAL